MISAALNFIILVATITCATGAVIFVLSIVNGIETYITPSFSAVLVFSVIDAVAIRLKIASTQQQEGEEE